MNGKLWGDDIINSLICIQYSYRLVKKCFLKVCETSKCHNFLIFQPIFIRFSLFCSENFTLSSDIKLDQFWTSPLNDLGYSHAPIMVMEGFLTTGLHKVFSHESRFEIAMTNCNCDNWINKWCIQEKLLCQVCSIAFQSGEKKRGSFLCSFSLHDANLRTHGPKYCHSNAHFALVWKQS